MTNEEALAELELEWPWSNKLHCPKHSDSDASLHLYRDGGFHCFSCGAHGHDGWGLLAFYLDVPVAQLLKDRGAGKTGPRPRSRWEQLDALEARALDAKYNFHRALRALPGTGPRRFFARLQAVEGRFDQVYGITWLARYFPEDDPPVRLEMIVKDIEAFYKRALSDEVRLHEMSEGL